MTCGAGQTLSWASFVDLTGDGWPDLTVTQDCNDPSVGTSRWSVYPGSASGFASSAISFQLPSTKEPLHVVGGIDQSCAPAKQSWQLDTHFGSRSPTLLLSQTCDDPAVGTAVWLAYAARCN
jgi:hypothetical protein